MNRNWPVCYILKIKTHFYSSGQGVNFHIWFISKKPFWNTKSKKQVNKRSNWKIKFYLQKIYTKLIYICSPWWELSKYLFVFCERHSSSKLLLVLHLHLVLVFAYISHIYCMRACKQCTCGCETIQSRKEMHIIQPLLFL